MTDSHNLCDDIGVKFMPTLSSINKQINKHILPLKVLFLDGFISKRCLCSNLEIENITVKICRLNFARMP